MNVQKDVLFYTLYLPWRHLWFDICQARCTTSRHLEWELPFPI